MNKDLSNISSILSVAGVWTPVNASDPTTHNAIPVANAFYSAIMLPDGKNGLAFNGWAYNGWDNKTHYPVGASILEQNTDGTLSDVTSKYLPDATTNGSGSVIVADFNGDGKQDIFFAAHNESPLIAKSSTAYLTNASGGFTKVTLNDHLEAHHAYLATLNNIPTVFIASFDGDPNPYYQYLNGRFVQTQSVGNTGYLTEQGFYFSSFSGANSIAVADFDSDGNVDMVIGDFVSGPSYQYVPNKTNIGIYKLSDLYSNTGSPELTLTPYFNSKSEYANVQSFMGPGQTHTYRVWTDDFNNDGRIDVLAGGSLWSSTDRSQSYSMLQMFQNATANGVMSFFDKTDTLNKDYNVKTAEVDYSMQMLDIDHSGIKTYLIAGSLTPYSDAVQSNYILLNDGTGAMHVYMHDQFQTIGNQVNAYLESLGVQSNTQPRFIEYLTADSKVNLEAEVQINSMVNGNSISQQEFINVPLRLDPTTDFTDNVTISDRNSSKLMRTWAGNDAFYDTNANTTASINGGLGIDKCIYSSNINTYTITHNSDGTTTVKNASLTDTLTNVERLQFADNSIALDTNGTGGQAYRMYQAAFDRKPDLSGLGYWISMIDNGLSLEGVAGGFTHSPEFQALYGANATDATFVTKLYSNVLHRTPDQGGYDYWTGLLANGGINREQMLVNFSESPENQAQVIGVIQNGFEYTPYG